MNLVLLAGIAVQLACSERCLSDQDRRVLRPDVEKGSVATNVQGHVGIFVAGSKRESICGGTFVTPDVVLTAAHCVATNSASRYEIRWGGPTSSRLPHQARVRQRALPAAYSGEAPAEDADYALLRIASGPVGVDVPNALADTTKTVRVRGWGWIDAHKNRSDTLLEAELAHVGTGGTIRDLRMRRGKPCLHDSGGGIRQGQGTREVLVGVLVNAGECGMGLTDAGYIPTEVWKSWVDDCLSATPKHCRWEP